MLKDACETVQPGDDSRLLPSFSKNCNSVAMVTRISYTQKEFYLPRAGKHVKIAPGRGGGQSIAYVYDSILQG
jgi:hypothetical protein